MYFISGSDKQKWFTQTPNTMVAVLSAIYILSETGSVSIAKSKGVGLAYTM